MALNCAIIGAGGIGRTHARCYVKDELSTLVAVCDIVPEKAQKFGEEFNIPWYARAK